MNVRAWWLMKCSHWLAALGHKDAALATLHKLLQRYPTYPGVHAGIGYLYAEQGGHQRAVEHSL